MGGARHSPGLEIRPGRVRYRLLLLALLAAGAIPVGGAQGGASLGHENLGDESCESGTAGGVWRAVGKAVVEDGAQQGAGGEWVAKDQGPGVWYFSSPDVFRCGKGGGGTLAFELGHLHFDAAGGEPVRGGHPDVVVRCRDGGKTSTLNHQTYN